MAVAARRPALEHGLDGLQSMADEIAHPRLGGDGAAGRLHRVAGDVEIADRVDFHGDGMAERPDAGAGKGVARQKAGLSGLVEIFEDRQ